MKDRQTFHSQVEYRNLLDSLVQPGCRWLDVGCGHTILPEWIAGSIPFQQQLLKRCDFAYGCDPIDDRPHQAGLPKYVGDCVNLPYPDGHFNLATANMVAEHIADPGTFAAEIHRVLIPGGKFVLHTPNLHHPLIFLSKLLPGALVRRIASRIDGRSDEDIFPTHYEMNTRKALSSLPGFRVLRIRCAPTGPILRKVPLLRLVESLLIKGASKPVLKHMQADWIVVLEKQEKPVSSTPSHSLVDA